MAGAHQVAAQILAAAQEIAEALIGRGRDVDKVQLAGGEQTSQALGVAAVGLDPIAGRPGDQAGRGDADVEASLGAGAGKAEPRGPGLIDRDQIGAECLEVGKRLLRRSLDPPAGELAGCEVEREHMGLIGVDVKAHARHSLGHGRRLPKLGCRPQACPAAQSPHFFARGAGLLLRPQDGAGRRSVLHRV